MLGDIYKPSRRTIRSVLTGGVFLLRVWLSDARGFMYPLCTDYARIGFSTVH